MGGDARCPRCGIGLVSGRTDAHKVCFDCPTCGGRLITLPVLREALGSAGIAALEHPGCVCPALGAFLGLRRRKQCDWKG